MPELPEVEVVRAGLDRHVTGARIEAVAPHATNQRELVRLAFRVPSTIHEVAERLRLPVSSICARRRELERHVGRLRDRGVKA